MLNVGFPRKVKSPKQYCLLPVCTRCVVLRVQTSSDTARHITTIVQNPWLQIALGNGDSKEKTNVVDFVRVAVDSEK